MNRELLNVKFHSKKIKLPKPAKEAGEKSGNPELVEKLIKLGFFIFVMAVMVYGAVLAIEYSASFCRGTSHESFKELAQDFRAYQSEQR